MRRMTYKCRLVIVVIFGITGSYAGWLYGACHQNCQEHSCWKTFNPNPLYPCRFTVPAMCYTDLWVRGFTAGVCKSKAGELTVWKCTGCDADCDPLLPSEADPCEGCIDPLVLQGQNKCDLNP